MLQILRGEDPAWKDKPRYTMTNFMETVITIVGTNLIQTIIGE